MPDRPVSQHLRAFAAALIVGLAVMLPGAALAQQKGYVGLEVRSLEAAESETLGWEAPRGAFVVQALPGAPAASAGVLAGDVIVSADGTEIESHMAFVTAISSKAPGTEVNLRLLRGGKERRAKLVLGVRPAALDQGTGGGKKCSKYMPSVGRSVEVDCPPQS